MNTVAVLATLVPVFIMLKTFWLNLLTITKLIRDGYNHTRDTIKYVRSYLIDTIGLYFIFNSILAKNEFKLNF